MTTTPTACTLRRQRTAVPVAPVVPDRTPASGMTVHCKVCNHQWEVAITLPMVIDRVVAVIRGVCAAGCPQCGAHGNAVMCGAAPVLVQQTDAEVAAVAAGGAR